ncbi:MAG: MFS transporter [Candidatus Bathyarchaeota archaeon]
MKKSFIAVYLSGLFFSLHVFTLFVYSPGFVEGLGATNFEVALLSSVHFMTSTVGSFIWGSLSDLMKNRKLLPIFSCILLPVFLFLLSGAFSPVQVILLRGLIGLVLPAYVAPILALISEEAGGKERGERLGWFNSVRSLGSTAGLFLASFLVAFISLASVFQIFSFLTVFATFMLIYGPGRVAEFSLPKFSRILLEFKRKLFPSRQGGGF